MQFGAWKCYFAPKKAILTRKSAPLHPKYHFAQQKFVCCPSTLVLCAVLGCANAHTTQRTAVGADPRPYYTFFLNFCPFSTPLRPFDPFLLLWNRFLDQILLSFKPFWRCFNRLWRLFYPRLALFLHTFRKFGRLSAAFTHTFLTILRSLTPL